MTRAKAVVAIIVSALGALITALGPSGTLNHIDAKHWLLAGIAVLGSGGLTWLVSNVAGVAGEIAKAIVAFLSAGFASLIFALQDNVITQSEWLIALSAAVVAGAAVYQVKNARAISRRKG